MAKQVTFKYFSSQSNFDADNSVDSGSISFVRVSETSGEPAFEIYKGRENVTTSKLIWDKISGVNTVLEKKIASLTTNVDTNTKAIGDSTKGLTKDVSDLKGQVSTNRNGIADLSSKVGTNEGKISANTTAISNINKTIPTLATKSEVDAKIKNISLITFLTSKDDLPKSNQDTNKIYVVPSGTPGTENNFVEYIWNAKNSTWEKLGEFKAEVDLKDYCKTSYVDGKLATKANADDLTALQARVATNESTFKTKADKTDLNDYYRKNEVDTKLGTKVNYSELTALQNTVNANTTNISKKADASALNNYYNKSTIDTKLATINTQLTWGGNAFN